MQHTHNKNKKYWYGGLLAAIGLGIFGFVVIKYIHQSRRANDEVIAQQIEQLKGIFKDINDTCKINGFRHEKDYVDFLNVAAFEGSIVGPMSVIEPKNWKGPYLKESLTSNGKEYQIIHTKKGYFVVPGDGVTLANGKVIGKTLVIDANSDIDAMMRDPQALLSNNKPLAAHIETYQSAEESKGKPASLEDVKVLE